MSVVLYRKYRPRSFSEVEGQEHVTKTLKSAIMHRKIAHAYIFIGPRGTGKTTVARILAKAVNCLDLKDGEPCNKCASCEAINQSKALDLVEIDAASNRGIDDMRALKENIGFSPSYLRYKVFIIDEVHMLTKEAFNALLKTLEEPPEHAIFILATTEVHKVPETIISRCQRFDFRRLTLDEIKKRLKEVAKAEGVEVEDGAINLIALNAGGALRDAESILGLIMSMEDKKITTLEAETVLGTPEISAVTGFLKFLGQKDATSSISHINKLNDDGYDLEQFAAALVEYLRQTLLIKVNPKLKDLIGGKLTEEQMAEMEKIAGLFSEEELFKMLGIFIDVQREIKSSLIVQLPLELAIVGILGNYNSAPQGVIEEPKSRPTFKTSAAKIDDTSKKEKDEKEDTKQDIAEKSTDIVSSKPENEPEVKPEPEQAPAPKQESQSILSFTKEDLLGKWSDIIMELKNYNHSLSAFMKACPVLDVKGDEVLLAASYNYHKEKLDENKSREIVNKVLDKIFGGSGAKLRLKIILEKDLEKFGYKMPEKQKNGGDMESAVLDILGGEVVQ